ncbi:MAG: hypothetical protein WCK88_00495 [bacterium]
MLPESKKTFTVTYSPSEETTQAPETTVVNMIPTTEVKKAESAKDVPPMQPDASLSDLQKKTDDLGIDRVPASVPLESQEPEKKPVAIDKLPQTGTPIFLLLGISIFL